MPEDMPEMTQERPTEVKFFFRKECICSCFCVSSDVTRYLFLSCDASASCLIRRHRTCMNEPSGQMRDETLHAVLARSTFGSQNVQDTPTPDHFWKYTTSTLIPLHSTPLSSTPLHYTTLHHTTLHYVTLYSTALSYTTPTTTNTSNTNATTLLYTTPH